MTKPSSFLTVSLVDLVTATGGVAPSLADIRRRAAPHCPATVARYAHVDPGSVTRSTAERMGNECMTEMGPFKAGFARPIIRNAIDEAFPPR